MILCANDASNAPGVYTSTDLLNWTAAPPLDAQLQECPDLFKIGDTYYLMGANHYASSKDLRGKFTLSDQPYIDRFGIYAGKRMFDGKRHIWVGWIADTEDLKDDSKLSWGGTMCTPRELVPGGLMAFSMCAQFRRPSTPLVGKFSIWDRPSPNSIRRSGLRQRISSQARWPRHKSSGPYQPKACSP